MIKVFFLIFEPNVAWEKIAQARRGLLFITVVHLLPLILAGTALETWGLLRHGKLQHLGMYKTFTNEEIITFESIQFVVFFAMVFATALLVYKIGQTFQDRLNFLQAFTTVAYGYSPIFLFHFLDASAAMPPAVPWLVGIGLVTWIFYQGIPRVMQPDPTHAFGVYISAIIVVILISGLARILTGMYLVGYMDLRHSWLYQKVAPILGH